MSRWPPALILAGFWVAHFLAIAFAGGNRDTESAEVAGLVFSPDASYLISASADGQLRLWDARQRKEVRQVVAHKGGAYGVAVAPDGRLIASAGADGKVRLWSFPTLKEVRTLEGHRDKAVVVTFSPDGLLLASGGYDRKVRLWDVATGKRTGELSVQPEIVTALVFSPDGKSLALGGHTFFASSFGKMHSTTFVTLWDVVRTKETRRLPCRGNAVAWAGNGRTVVAAADYWYCKEEQGRKVYRSASPLAFFDLARNKEFQAQNKVLGSSSICQNTLALSSDGRFLATGWGSSLHPQGTTTLLDTSGGIQLWEVVSREPVLKFRAERNDATVVAISPDHRLLVSGRESGQIDFRELTPPGWDAARQTKRRTPDEIGKLWEALSGRDAARAYEALWSLIAAGEQTVACFRTPIRPAQEKADRVQQLLGDLDSNRFVVREAATKELTLLGAEAEAAAQRAFDRKPPLELRNRLERILAELAVQHAFQVRVICVLERIGTQSARQQLKTLADGAEAAWQTREARAALERLSRPTPAAPR